jgi:hypothetical protein
LFFSFVRDVLSGQITRLDAIAADVECLLFRSASMELSTVSVRRPGFVQAQIDGRGDGQIVHGGALIDGGRDGITRDREDGARRARLDRGCHAANLLWLLAQRRY